MHNLRFASALLFFSPLLVSVAQIHGESNSVSAETPAPVPAPVNPASPVTFFSIDSPQMNTWAERPQAKAVLTGRLLDLPPEKASQVAISYSLNTLYSQRQQKKTCLLEPDGTFRIEIDSTFPWQQFWLNISPFYQGVVLLHRDLHLELDVPKLPRRNSGDMSGIVFSGTDGALNEEVNRFTYFFQTERRQKIVRAISQAKVDSKGDYAARLAIISQAKRDYEEFIKEFSPQLAGLYFQNEIDARYYEAVLWAAMFAKHALEEEPIWQEIVHHPSYVVSNEQVGFYSSLHAYLDTMHGPHRMAIEELVPPPEAVTQASPEIKEAYRVASTAPVRKDLDSPLSPELQAALDTLRKGGLISPVHMQVKKLNEAVGSSLPTAKLEISHLFFVPKGAAEARLAIAELRRRASLPWIRSYLDQIDGAQQSRLNAINATLAQGRSGAVTDSLGQLMVELPSGARLYHLPELSGQEMLARLAQTFPHKALILDFWGPWCAPCLSDIPYSQKAHEALKDAPVEFIYFGSRTEEDPWKRTIAELHLSGTHILLEKKQVDELMTFFNGTGFPTYVFIDRQGKVQPGAISWFRRTTPEDIRQLLE